MRRFHKFVDDVMTGKLRLNKYARLAVERHVNDLKRSDFYFDEEAAQHRLDFYGLCKHFQGRWAGKVIDPSGWQVFIAACVFGWKRPNGLRRFKEAYRSMARKNGKSTDMSTDGLYLTGCDGEAGAQVYSIATKKEQARIVWEMAEAMVYESKPLKTLFKVSPSRNLIRVPRSYSKFLPLAKEAKTEDGLNPHGTLVDEFHAHPDSRLIDVLKSGRGSREQPVLDIITTRGFDVDCPCKEYEEMIVEMLEGRIDLDHIFGMIFELDEGDDWQNHELWYKPNPNLGVSVFLEGDLLDEYKEALHLPTSEINFKTKRLNMWTQSKSKWFTEEAWNGCGNHVIEERALYGRRAWGGLDCSTTTDFTAWVVCVPVKGVYHLLLRCFVPRDNIYELENKCRVPLRKWCDKGLIIATPGEVIDYEYVETQIKKDFENFDMQEYAFDPWNATSIINNLEGCGVEAVEMRQGFATMSPASKRFEKKVLAKEVEHYDNPLLSWMARCTEIAEDPAGNIKPIKPKRSRSAKRIDGIIASVMAASRADVGNIVKKESVYSRRGIRTV